MSTDFRTENETIKADDLLLVGLTAQPQSREVLQIAELFRGRLQWFDHHAWPIEDVEILDARTVRFRFRHAYPYQVVDANDGRILPAHAWSGLPFESWRRSAASRCLVS